MIYCMFKLSYSIVAMDIFLRPMVLSLPLLFCQVPICIILHSLRVLLRYGFLSLLVYRLWFCMTIFQTSFIIVCTKCCMTINFVPKLMLTYIYYTNFLMHSVDFRDVILKSIFLNDQSLCTFCAIYCVPIPSVIATQWLMEQN